VSRVRRGVRLAAALAIAIPWSLGGAAPATAACTCEDGGSPRQVLRSADAAVIGEVIGNRSVGGGTMQRIRVDEVFVGEPSREIEIFTRLGGGVVDPCAVAFGSGEPIALVLTRDAAGRYVQDRCALMDVGTLRRIGGPPAAPATAQPTASPTPGSAGTDAGPSRPWPWWLVASVGAGAGVVLIGGSLVWGRRRAAEAAEPGEPEGPVPSG
jgi:hypothetical protein